MYRNLLIHLIHIRWWFNHSYIHIMIIVARWCMTSTARWSTGCFRWFDCSLIIVDFLQKTRIPTTKETNIIGIDRCSFAMSKEIHSFLSKTTNLYFANASRSWQNVPICWNVISPIAATTFLSTVTLDWVCNCSQIFPHAAWSAAFNL